MSYHNAGVPDINMRVTTFRQYLWPCSGDSNIKYFFYTNLTTSSTIIYIHIYKLHMRTFMYIGITIYEIIITTINASLQYTTYVLSDRNPIRKRLNDVLTIKLPSLFNRSRYLRCSVICSDNINIYQSYWTCFISYLNYRSRVSRFNFPQFRMHVKINIYFFSSEYETFYFGYPSVPESSQDLLYVIKKKHRSYKILNRGTITRRSYVSYRNILTVLIRKCKQFYYKTNCIYLVITPRKLGIY